MKSPFSPPELHRRREAWSVDQLDPLPAMRMRDDPAGGAAHHRRRSGFDLDPEPRVVAMDTGHVEPGQPDQKVAALAVTASGMAAGSRIGHRRGPRNRLVW